ncbi:MAG: hypothetical protein WC683_10480 [bacterium]
MEIEGKQHVALYLTDWQIRMIKDVLGIETQVWNVPVTSPPVLKYMPPKARAVPPTAKRMYLTEWQCKEIKDETGEDCEFVELTSEIVPRYMAPPRVAKKKP